MTVCLVPGCGKQVDLGGLCYTCYNDAMRLVDMRRTTWKELEDFGLYAAKSERPIMQAVLDKRAQKARMVRHYICCVCGITYRFNSRTEYPTCPICGSHNFAHSWP